MSIPLLEIYKAALNGYCYRCEAALVLHRNDWLEECPRCGRRYQARDGRLILSEPNEHRVNIQFVESIR